MKKLYLDIDGVLLTAKETRAADFVLPFIDYITNNFDCYWLTTHCKGDTAPALFHLSNYLNKETIQKLKIIKPTTWVTLKTEAIDFSSDFYWIDDNPLRVEINLINTKSSSLNDKLIIVDLNRQDELKHTMQKLKV